MVFHSVTLVLLHECGTQTCMSSYRCQHCLTPGLGHHQALNDVTCSLENVTQNLDTYRAYLSKLPRYLPLCLGWVNQDVSGGLEPGQLVYLQEGKLKLQTAQWAKLPLEGFIIAETGPSNLWMLPLISVSKSKRLCHMWSVPSPILLYWPGLHLTQIRF